MKQYLFKLSILFTLAMLCIFLYPSVWLSYHTPFRLIDDYICFNASIEKFREPMKWLFNFFAHTGDERTFIIHDMGDYLYWNIFRENFGLHHIFRLFLKCVCFFFLMLTCLNLNSYFSLKNQINKSLLFIYLIFCFVIFFFFPNNPEARLATQEISSVFFAALTIFVLTSPNWRIEKTKTALLFIFFWAYILSKEPNIISGFVILIWIGTTYFQKHKTELKIFLLKLSPFILVYLHFFIKVYISAQGHNIQGIGIEQIYKNIFYSYKVIFQGPLNTFIILIPIIIAIILFLVKIVKKQINLTYSKNKVDFIFLFILLLSSYVTLLMNWGITLRYAFIVWFFICFFSFAVILRLITKEQNFFKGYKRLAPYLLILSAALFFIRNYPYHLSQFYAQWESAIIEQDILIEGKKYFDKVNPNEFCILGPISEYEHSMKLYYNTYYPNMHKEEYFSKNQTIKRIESIDIGKLTTASDCNYIIARANSIANYSMIYKTGNPSFYLYEDKAKPKKHLLQELFIHIFPFFNSYKPLHIKFLPAFKEELARFDNGVIFGYPPLHIHQKIGLNK